MIVDFPKIEIQRLAVKVKLVAEKAIRQGHPWVFESSISKVNKPGKSGDLAILFDRKDNKFLAVGLWDEEGPIRIRILQVKQQAKIDEQWFQRKITDAYELRKPLLETDTNSYRLIHGENDGFSGLIADVYEAVLVLKLYSTVWLPYLEHILHALKAVSKVKTIVLRLNRQLEQNPSVSKYVQNGQIILGTLHQEEIIFREHGLKFKANVIKGHKTGFFLDHRANRLKVRTLSEGKTVLDVFAYAGGFSVHALAGGAKKVISLDISKQALEMARQNVRLNFDNAPHETIAIDAFKGLELLREKGRKFDLIIIDPPSFAKQQNEVPLAIKNYRKLIELAIPLIRNNGVLLAASCSSRVSREDFFGIVEEALEKANIFYKCIEKTYHDIDHPISFPEGAYLKSGYYRIG